MGGGVMNVLLATEGSAQSTAAINAAVQLLWEED
jgi:hypothetical protein